MSLDPTLAAGLIELAKLSLQGYFSAMRQAGKTEDEINQLFEEEYAGFKARHPDDLPDV